MSPASDSAHDASPQYEFIKLLGRGGMAEVFLAHKLTPGGGFKPVAFKRILPQFTADPMRVSKFLDEIATAAALVHPNIVGIHHWGVYEGDYFIEMECIRGITLMDYLEAHATTKDKGAFGPIPALDVALIGAMVAEGLHYAHTFERGAVTGFVHRDVSPDNVMIDTHGRAKILDYGIAKALKGADRVASKTSTAAGKPYYHPPEQWRGDEVDARADLYALGTTLAVALCGRQLFTAGPGESFEYIVYRVFQSDRPPIADIAPPGTPPELVDLLEGLVKADRDQRQPRDAKQLAQALKRIARSLGGDLDNAREQLAARIKEHYKGDSDTFKVLTPPQFSESREVPARSTRRPIDPATRRERAKHAGGTVPLEQTPSPAAPSAPALETTANLAQPRSGARPLLIAALGVGLLVAVCLAAGLAGLILNGWSTSQPHVNPDPPAAPPTAPAPSAPAPNEPSTATPIAGATETTQAPRPQGATPAADESTDATQPPSSAPAEPDEESEPDATDTAAPAAAEPTPTRRRRSSRRRTTPTPEVRPLAPGPSTSPDRRGRARTPTPTLSDFGFGD